MFLCQDDNDEPRPQSFVMCTREADTTNQRLDAPQGSDPRAKQPRKPARSRVIRQAEPSPGAEHPCDLLEAPRLVRPMMERQAADNEIDGLIRNGERLSGATCMVALGVRRLA